MRQLPVPRVLVHPPDEVALRRAEVVVVLHLLERPIDDHSPRCFIHDDLGLHRLVLKPATAVVKLPRERAPVIVETPDPPREHIGARLGCAELVAPAGRHPAPH
jgi:hypothetical protein